MISIFDAGCAAGPLLRRLAVSSLIFAALVLGQTPKYTPTGGEIEVSTKGLNILYRAPIEVPPSTKAEGNTIIRVAIDAAGNVTSATAVEDSKVMKPAPAELREAALKAIRKWRFAAGHPVGPNDPTNEIIVTFKQPENIDPAAAYVKHGDELYRTGQTDKALLWYEQGEQKYPEKKIELLKRQTEIYARQGNKSKIKSTLNAILKVDPRDSEARGLKASLLLDEGGDTTMVVSELTDIIKTKPNDVVAHYNLGRAYLVESRTAQAEQEFSTAIQLQPDYFAARMSRAELLLKKPNYEAALKDLDHVLKFKPTDITAKVLKASALTGLYRFGEAGKLVKEVLAVEPNNVQGVAVKKILDDLQKQPQVDLQKKPQK